MNLKSQSLVAALAAICFAVPFTAHADETSNPRVFLGIEAVCGQGSHVFNIRNTGTTTSSMLRYKLIARANEVMPALRSWDLFLTPIGPGQVYQLSVPRSAWGLKLSIEIAADARTQVTQAQKSVSYPSFCW